MAYNYQKGVALEEKKPLIYCDSSNPEKVIAFYDNIYHKMDRSDIEHYRKNPRSSPFVLIREEVSNKNRLKEIHVEFIADANAMKEATDGLINMYKTGRNALTSIKLAYHFMTKNGYRKPEDITPEEATWLENASQGAIIFADQYEGPAYKYDINSSYPSVYSSHTFAVPFKQGEFMKVSKEEFENMRYYKYGIYHCVIDYPDKESKWKKLFRLNFSNYYTHYDLSQAKKLGLIMNIVEEADHNLLHWSKDKLIVGSKLFGDFTKLLYKLKQEPATKSRAKQLLACLWGSLCQDNMNTMTVKEDDPSLEFADDRVIDEITPIKGGFKVRFYYGNNRYETNWSRLKPFLLAKARNKISDYIEPHVDHVLRCHTDSMTSDIELPIKHSIDIGKMKLEGFCENCVIVNSVTVIGEFKIMA